MATKTSANGAVTSSSTKNNGGVGMNIGSASSVLSKEESNNASRNNQVFASTPKDDASADKALSGGTFASESPRGVQQRVTSTLAGVSKDFLTFAAGVTPNARSIARQELVKTTDLTAKIRAGKWNPTTGKFSPALASQTDQFWSISADALQATSSDEAATPTRAKPGELSFHHGAASGPKSVDYSAKNG